VSTVPADLSGQSDAELISSVRDGTLAAYGPLYERHVAAAYNLARQLARSTAEADDLVSEAFAKVLDTLRGGKGPDSAFRAYLLTALRHTAYDKTRRDRRVDLNEDMSEVGGPAAEALTVPFSDTAVAGLERTMAAKAFARLPERWQAVLWHTEIERQTPAEVAPLLGLTANGVSALAYRAREGLRQAYLQVHLAETSAERCRATAERLGAWTRDGLSKRERTQVEAHLDECDRCRALAAELADVNGALRAVVAPIVLGGAVFGYLAATGALKASAATAAAAGAAAGSASGAAGAAAAGGPRQFVGVAASGAAMAAAIAVGLAAGSTGQEIPAAAQQPPPVVAPAVPQPPAPPPAPPAPPAPPPPAAPPAAPPAPQAPPPAQPAPAPVAPPAAPAPAPSPAPAPPPPAPPSPQPPKITAQPPANIALQPGDGPVELPITVRNDGGSPSEPVVASLNLPPGVRAVPAGGGGGAPGGGARSLAAQADGGSLTVQCPPGSGMVTCRTDRGLQPGESAVLVWRLVADRDAKPGEVTGSITSGTSMKVDVKVQVSVKPSPDSMELKVGKLWSTSFPWEHAAWVSVDVNNTGPNSRPVTVTLNRPGRLVLGGWRASCDENGTTTCHSTGDLDPGEHLRLWFELDHRPSPEEAVTVSATLGTATSAQTVYFDCWGPECDWPHHPWPVPPTGPTTTTTTSTTPDTSTPSKPTKPGGTSTTTTTKPTSSSPSGEAPERNDPEVGGGGGGRVPAGAPEVTTTTTPPPPAKPWWQFW
jgi:RNA polymerase sigma factor (sigma-70 family)